MRDAPAARLELLTQTYRGTNGRRRLPYRRAALSFMCWEDRRGILNPPDAQEPGSAWWREVNDRLLHDSCEALARLEGRGGGTAPASVRMWLDFVARPTAAGWYRAHNASIAGAYVEHQALAAREHLPERFFMNVVLLRVLYAHALVGAPRLALGWFSPLGRLLGDPRLGMAGVFLSLSRVLPDRYPLTEQDIAPYLAEEQRAGRFMDYAVIAPRLQALYEWSADELELPELLEFIDEGRPRYALPGDHTQTWSGSHLSWPERAAGRLLRPR